MGRLPLIFRSKQTPFQHHLERSLLSVELVKLKRGLLVGERGEDRKQD